MINTEIARGFYDYSCALWAINSDNYQAVKDNQDKVDEFVKLVLDDLEYGYVSSGFSKFDDTGFALLALAPYYKGQASGKYNNSKEVKETVARALDYIKEEQLEDGDFTNGGAWGAPNSNTLSMVIMGLSAIDSELIWSEDYRSEDGKYLLEVLKAKYDIAEGFKWKETDENPNAMAIEQGLRALIETSLDNKTNVFDLREVEKKEYEDIKLVEQIKEDFASNKELIERIEKLEDKSVEKIKEIMIEEGVSLLEKMDSEKITSLIREEDNKFENVLVGPRSVDKNKVWKIYFNMDLDLDQIEALVLEEDNENKEIVVYRENKRSISILPIKEYANNKEYKLKIQLKNGDKYIRVFEVK